MTSLILRLVVRFLLGIKRSPATEGIVLAGWVGALAAVEIAGRRSSSDAVDALLALAVMPLPLITAIVHRLRPLRTVTWLAERRRQGCAVMARQRIQFGADLRLTPPIRRGLPAVYLCAVLVPAALAALLWSAAGWFPFGARDFLTGWCYLAYLACLLVVWGIGALVLLALGIVIWAVLHDACIAVYRGHGRRPARTEVLVVCLAFAAIGAAAQGAPVWIPWCACGVLVIVLTIACGLSSSGLVVLWRHTIRAGRVVRSFDGRWSLWITMVAPLLVAFDLAILSCGQLLRDDGAAMASVSMPLTTTLGRLTGWMTLAGTSALLYYGVRFVALGMLFNPRRPPQPAAHVAGRLSAAERGQVAGLLGQIGWKARFAPRAPRRSDVRIHVQGTSAAPSSAAAAATLDVSLEALASPLFVERLNRRAAVHYRRLLIRGLEMLFKRGARLTDPPGTGWWIGLQHWFITGLSRDEGDATDDRDISALDGMIGPPFYRVFPRAVRHHFWQMTQALQVDLLFLEDGVSFRRFTRVLRVLFEIYDMHGGRERAEERHFTGLPGVRVVIHDFDMGSSPAHGQAGYPEPDYDEIGRARIVHVFKDRGGDHERIPHPESSTDLPVWSAPELSLA